MNITHTELVNLIDYDLVTGMFVRKNTGKKTGCIQRNGYMTIRLNSKLYYAHRLAWFYIYQIWPNFIDHKNGIRTDNSLTNLRASTRTENNQNISQKSSNQSGYKGVSYSKIMSKWQATITAHRKQHRLGYFDDPAHAAAAYDAASIQLHGAFAKTNQSLGLIP